MTNIHLKNKTANLQEFYKNFPMQAHASVNLPKRAIVYRVPDVFLDTVAGAAEQMITRLKLPMEVIRVDCLADVFIVKEVSDVG